MATSFPKEEFKKEHEGKLILLMIMIMSMMIMMRMMIMMMTTKVTIKKGFE